MLSVVGRARRRASSWTEASRSGVVTRDVPALGPGIGSPRQVCPQAAFAIRRIGGVERLAVPGAVDRLDSAEATVHDQPDTGGPSGGWLWVLFTFSPPVFAAPRAPPFRRPERADRSFAFPARFNTNLC